MGGPNILKVANILRHIDRMKCLFLVIFLTACMESNNANVLLYSTKAHYLNSDPFSQGNGIEFSFRKTAGSELVFQYAEPNRINLFLDTLDNNIELSINSAPDLMKKEFAFEKRNIRIVFFTFDDPIDTGRISVVRIEKYNETEQWTKYFEGPFVWKDLPTESKKQMEIRFPLDLFGINPAFSWSLMRKINGETILMPSQPCIFIQNENGFKALLH